jgi:hypothetical protein
VLVQTVAELCAGDRVSRRYKYIIQRTSSFMPILSSVIVFQLSAQCLSISK